MKKYLLWAMSFAAVGTLLVAKAGAELRPLRTDRPDKTESPYSVDPGMFQMEADILNYNRAGTRSNLGGSLMNWKYGINASMDIQVVVEALRIVRDTGVASTGFGDLTVRYKWNWLGNDSGSWGIGIMPFLVFPTGSSVLGPRRLGGGVILPLSASLPWDFEMGTMAQFNFKPDAGANTYTLSGVYTLTFAHPIVGELSEYMEIFIEQPFRQNMDPIITADFGLTFLMTPNLQWDAGINIGLTDVADDYNPFLGVTVRF